MLLLSKNEGKEYGLFRYAVLYSELKERLNELRAKYPENLRVDIIGHSNGGRELYLVTLAKDVSDAAIADFAAKRQSLCNDPAAALATYEGVVCGTGKPVPYTQGEKPVVCGTGKPVPYAQGENSPLPIFADCNLHGSEISGTDGMLSFIDEALSGPQKAQYLDDAVILISICTNPDGRARGFDIMNGHFVDLNRDWMAQSQPEVRALVENVFHRFYPSILLDLHGYMSCDNILIDACTEPHNPFMEYDIIERHMKPDARAIARAIKRGTNLETDIAAEKWEDGWEDYSPVYTATYSICLGAVSHTLETHFPSEEGAEVAKCALEGVLDYVHENKSSIFKDQCEFYLRGSSAAQTIPIDGGAYYIPTHRETHLDLDTISKTIDRMLANRIQIFEDDGGYIVPMNQPLRALVCNMLWEGEDITDRIQNCYDVSFCSYPIMCGFDACLLSEAETAERMQNAKRISEPRQSISTFDRKTPSLDSKVLRISCKTNAAYALSNRLIRSGTKVQRAAEPDKNPLSAAGDFIVTDISDSDIPTDKDIRAWYCEKPDESLLLPTLSSPKALIVADSGGIGEALDDLGFDCDILPFSQLNIGYRINPSDYDVLIVGGTESSLWSDPFDEKLGVGYQNSWALRERGRRELIRAANEFRHLILYAFSGKRLSEELSRAECTEVRQAETASKDSALAGLLSVPNGSFKLRLNPADPLFYGYREEETFYLVAPLAFETTQSQPSAFYAQDCFINGFNKRKHEMDDKAAAFISEEGDGKKTVMLGFDPAFRGYTDATFRVAANALFHVGS